MMFARLIGLIPLAIGLALFWDAWGPAAPMGPFGSSHKPPLIFLIFESAFGSIFLMLGVGALLGRLHSSPVERLKVLQEEMREAGLIPPESSTLSPSQPGKLKCPNCGSSPGTAEVSPHGDVKCDHCSRWYNVHTA